MDVQADGCTGRWMYRQVNAQVDECTGNSSEAFPQTDGQTDRQKNRQTDRIEPKAKTNILKMRCFKNFSFKN